VPLRTVLERLQATTNGLTSAEARARLDRYGSNVLPTGSGVSAWRVWLAQFRSVITLLLVAAAIAAIATGDPLDAVAIGIVLALNVSIGFAMEIRAHRAVEGLSRLEPRRATVVRDGAAQDIDARDLVPGDLVLLDSGQTVPADARLIVASDLRVVEATLTGESVPVLKDASRPVAPDAALPDRFNMVFASTTIAAGSARAVVVATGVQTELGAIGRLLRTTRAEPTPLERQLDALGRQLVWVALAIGLATFILGAAQQKPVALMLEAGIAIAVAAVPEGLPVVATMTLALGVRRMARRQALVRRLASVETLGSVTVICSDKTGTLTTGAMTVTTIWAGGRTFEVTGEGYAPEGQFVLDGISVDPHSTAALRRALEIGALASRGDAVRVSGAWLPRGDPTEAALVVAARKAGVDRDALLRHGAEAAEVPFSSDRPLMAVFHRSGDAYVAYVKGSPLRVLDLCARVMREGDDRPLDAAARCAIEQVNERLAARGLRVLAVADGTTRSTGESALTGLRFVGLVGMMDPPAPGVKEAIHAFRTAGIRTVMITGDQHGTAVAIARDLDLVPAVGPADVLEGREVDGLSDDALSERLARVTVISRVSPAAKLRIVAAYQRRGEIVAMIGDGVNDAAALKKADVGVTMGGRGTDVARESADIVLLDDRFQTIGAAIEEGRVVFDNIRRFVFYLFSCNLAEIAVLLGAGVVGLPLPLHPMQILWLNLVTDTAPALALAFEPAEPGAMQRPPRDPSAALLSPAFVRRILAYGVAVAAAVFVVMGWAAQTGVPGDRALTMNFLTLAFAQLFHVANARTAEAWPLSWQSARMNPAAVMAVVGVIAIQLAAIHIDGWGGLLRLTPLTATEWVVVSGAALLPVAAGQIVRRRSRRGAGAPAGCRVRDAWACRTSSSGRSWPPRSPGAGM
jgi:Ca2+-transporting ATPase